VWTHVVVGILTLAICVAVQSAAAALVVRVAVRMLQRGYGRRLWSAVLILQITTIILLAAFLAQIAVWAVVFRACGEFADYDQAFYHSAVNFTTLGYGDIVMSEQWRLLGPLEAANGVLMGGLAGAVLFTLLTRLADAVRQATG
jgi:hypothetical protein